MSSNRQLFPDNQIRFQELREYCKLFFWWWWCSPQFKKSKILPRFSSCDWDSGKAKIRMRKFALTINLKLKKLGLFGLGCILLPRQTRRMWTRVHACLYSVNFKICIVNFYQVPGYMPARLCQNEIFALSSYQGTYLSFFSQNKIIFCQNTSVRTPSLDSDVSSTFGRVSVARSFYIRWTFDVIVESNLKLCE